MGTTVKDLDTESRRSEKKVHEPDLADISHAWFETLASFTGALAAPVLLYTILLWMRWYGLFAARCPETAGRMCNTPYGQCNTDTGFCACTPLWSGEAGACERTLCPGYDPETNHVCLGRGHCSPFVLFNNNSRYGLPDGTGTRHSACHEWTPSEANGFSRGPGGWHTEACAMELAEALAADPATPYLPRCQCDPPFFGEYCPSRFCRALFSIGHPAVHSCGLHVHSRVLL